MNEVKKYQIRMLGSDGCGSFLYFDSTTDDSRIKAVECANAYLDTVLAYNENKYGIIFFQKKKIIQKPIVVEYDTEKHKAKRKGESFKLKLISAKIYGTRVGVYVHDN